MFMKDKYDAQGNATGFKGRFPETLPAGAKAQAKLNRNIIIIGNKNFKIYYYYYHYC